MLKIVFALFACSLFMAHADDVVVNVTGRIAASPCNVDAGTTNQTVDLGQAVATDFKQAGAGSKWHDFDLKLSGCPATTTYAAALFMGQPDPTSTTKFANLGTSTGLALDIENRNHDTSYGPNDRFTVPVNDSDHKATFPLSARMYSTSGTVTGGSFSSVVQVVFIYN